MSRILHLPFSEPATNLLPSDAEGNLTDFSGDTGATPDLDLPVVGDGLTGPARVFGDDIGLQTLDTAEVTRLEKDLSIQVLISLDLTAQDALGARAVVLGYGRAFQLQVDVQSLVSSIARMRLGWGADSESDSDVAGADWGYFVVPASGWLLLTATRHWTSSTSVRVRYYCQDVLLGEVTSTYGDIDAMTGAYLVPTSTPTVVTWASLVNATDNGGGELENTGGGGVAWDTGAISTRTITGDGYVEFVAEAATNLLICGLSNGNVGVNWDDVDFNFRLNTTGVLHIYENATQIGAYGTYQVGDIFRIQVADGVVSYWHNGVFLYESLAAPTFPLLVDCALFTAGGIIEAAVFTDAVAAPVTVGCRQIGADYESFLAADIDGLLLTDEEMSFEEVRQVYRRIAVHQPAGRDIIRPMLAAGTAYSMDLDSGIQREVAVEGDALGLAHSKSEELREDYLPDRAWSVLDDWERVSRLPPGGRDTVEERRARLVSYLRTVHGYAEEDVQTALAAALATDSSNVEIVNYTNRYEDAFTVLVADYWTKIQRAGAVGVTSAQLRFTLPIATDGRWESRSDSAGPTMLRMPIDGDVRDADPSDGVDLQVQVVSTLAADFDNGNYAGLFAYNVAGDLLFVGWRKSGGVISYGTRVYSGGAWAAWNSIAVASPPGYIRMRFDGGTDWVVVHDATDPDAALPSSTTAITGIGLPTNAGLIQMTDVASNPAATIVDLDNFRAYMPLGLRVFNWYASADPALSGTPDLDAARAIIEKMKPADSDGGAISVTSGYLECGDTEHGCGEAPTK